MSKAVENHHLFEEMPVWRALLKLAVPTLIGQVILVIYNMADTFFIGMCGTDAMLTSVTVCLPAFMFLSAISNLFGVGGASVIARAMGARAPQRAKVAASFAFWGCLLVTGAYCLAAFYLADPFLDLLGGTAPSVHMLARQYLFLTVICGGVGSSMGMLLSHLIRSIGDSSVASAGIILGGSLNIALDPLFIFVILPPGSEVFGAALATMLSNFATLAFFTAALIRRRKKYQIFSFVPTPKMFRSGIPSAVISVGIPACVMTLFENISYGVLEKLISFYGIPMQAGFGVAKKINMLSHSIVRGIAQGALPLIGFNFAAGNRKRMRSAVLLAQVMAVSAGIICMIVYLQFSRELTQVFIQRDSSSLDYGAAFLRILCIGGPFSACAYTFISFFQAVGHSLKSLFLATLRKGLLDIPLMFILRVFLPLYGPVIATPAADIACCIISIIVFARFMHAHKDLGPGPAPEIPDASGPV